MVVSHIERVALTLGWNKNVVLNGEKLGTAPKIDKSAMQRAVVERIIENKKSEEVAIQLAKHNQSVEDYLMR